VRAHRDVALRQPPGSYLRVTFATRQEALVRVVGHPDSCPYDWEALSARVTRAREMAGDDRLDEAEFIVRGARRVIERYEHRSARWGVMTLDLARFRCLAGDWKGCLRLARQAASSLANSGRASGGLPYAHACMFIGRSHLELGEDACAVRFLNVASSAGQAWGEQGAWIADAADMDLGTALVRLKRWVDAREPLERAWRIVMTEPYPRAARRRTGAFYATALYRTDRLDEAWKVIRVCILDLGDEAVWHLAMNIMAAMDARGDGQRAVRLWYSMEDDYESGAGSERPRPKAVNSAQRSERETLSATPDAPTCA